MVERASATIKLHVAFPSDVKLILEYDSSSIIHESHFEMNVIDHNFQHEVLIHIQPLLSFSETSFKYIFLFFKKERASIRVQAWIHNERRVLPLLENHALK